MVRAIVCVDSKWGIGRDNQLLFNLPEDMARFKAETTGKIVIMGANTWRSLPNKPLPNRTNIVLDWNGTTYPGAQTATSIRHLDQLLSSRDCEDIFIIGGAAVYGVMVPLCDEVLVTKVFADGNADRFFPNLDQDTSFEVVYKGEELVSSRGLQYQFLTYRNKKF